MREKYIKKANLVHNNKYDYSKLIYTNLNNKGIIICPIHGEFEQNLHAHLYLKQGCKLCGIESRINKRKKTLIEFKRNASYIHNNKYDYSLVEYINNSTKVIIICPIHGKFEQIPKDHLNGHGCSKCGGTSKLIKEDIIINLNNIHNNKYDYSKLKYINGKNKIKIICPIHGEFEQTLENHKNRQSGCPKCHIAQSSYEKEIIKILISIKPDLKILNNISINKINELNMNNNFLDKIKDKPITLLSPYIKNSEKIKVKCNICNHEWSVLSSNLNKGNGCPNCFNRISSYENETYDIFKNENIQRNKRFNNYEIDIFFPDYNLGIEFHGLYYHSDKFKNKNYHKDKYLKFKELNIDLIQIFENEWINKKDIVLSIIKNRLGLNKEKIFARKCEIKNIDTETAKQFCNDNHIQGYASSSVKIGLFYKDELVSLITLRKNRFNKNSIQEIIRFCNKKDLTIIGGFNKLLSYIKNSLHINELSSFVDVRYFNGNSYKNYKFEYHTVPNYFYFKTNKLLQNRMMFQKHKLKNKLPIFNETLSEYENMELNGYYRIFDAGNLKFKLDL